MSFINRIKAQRFLKIIRGKKLLSIAVLIFTICGFLFSYFAYDSIKKQIAKEDRESFIRDAEFYLKTVEKRFHTANNFLESLDRLIQMAPDLSRKDFSKFNTAEDLHALGIQTSAWSPLVKHKDRKKFVENIRASGLFDFDIRDIGDGYNPAANIRIKYTPILYTEPIHDTGHIQGVDLFDLADEKQNFVSAIGNGQTTMSNIIPLTMNDTKEYGFWLHMPIYNPLSNQITPSERHHNFKGFASVTLLAEELFTPLNLNPDDDFGFQVIVAQDYYIRSFSTHPDKEINFNADIIWQKTVLFADRNITFSFQKLNLTGIDGRSSVPIFALIIGIISTLVLASYLVASIIRTHRIETQVRNRTKDLKLSNERLRDAIIHREKATNDQNRAETRYQRIFENAVEGIFSLGSKGDIVNANPSFASIFGFKNIDQLKSSHANFNGLIHCSDRRKLQSEFLRNKGLMNVECRAYNQSGAHIYLSINANYVSEDSDIIIEGTIADITDRKIAEAQLNEFAYLDVLTNCLNRRAFNELLGTRFSKADRFGDWSFALLFIDLDHFKLINDTQGHDAGDIVIQEVANRLRNAIRESASIARLGGDEFAILLDDIDTPEHLHEISQRILKQLSEPFPTKDRPFLTSGSIGVALVHNNDVVDPANLMRNADLAMYQAKKAGRNQCVIYSEDFHTEADEQLRLQNALHNAIENNELSMVYQPVINMKSGQLIAIEALLRWQHPFFGAVSPAQFIPLAEKVGLISEIGDWSIDRILQDMKKMQMEEKLEDIRMNINMSPIQLCQSDFCNFLIKKCAGYEINRNTIALELTETAMVEDHINIDHYLSLLTKSGFRVLVDDFGTGYASLNQLTVTNWNGIKIDRNFVEGLETDDNKYAITCAVLSMAETIGYEVTAEGIETEGQRDLLLNLGCHVGQGYLFGKPMPMNQIIENARSDYQYTTPRRNHFRKGLT